MRRLFVIAAALGLMWALDQAKGGAARGDLAAIGFVVLAAFTVGDLLSAIGLPRITGYIVSGVVLGPHIAGVLSSSVVVHMKVFNTLALGLIALSAGLEIELGPMRRVARTMLATIAAKVVLLLVLVAGGLYLTSIYILPLPVADDARAVFLVVLLAVLATGTSPSITLAIVNETKARGRLTDLTLGAAVLKDVVVIVLLAVTIAIGRNAIAPDASAIAPVIVAMAKRLGFSIALGAAIGVILILYVKYVRRELLLAAVCAVLLTAEVSEYLDLELLLVLITAGCIVRNASHRVHELVPALQRVSLPVFVVFFTGAGANIDLEAVRSVLPFAGWVAVGRLVAFYVASRFGSWVGRESEDVRRNSWLAYMPQAGVTLGLVFLAASQVPELRPQILQIGLAMVAINLLTGPVLQKLALGRAGEIPGRAARPAPVKRVRTAPIAIPAPPRRRLAPLSSTLLEESRAKLAGDLDAWAARFVEQVVGPLAERGKLAIARLVAEHKQGDNAATAVRKMLEAAPADPSDGLELQLRAAFLEVRAAIEQLPERRTVPLEGVLLRLSLRDGALVWVSKLVKRLARAVGLVPHRTVPIRLAARFTSEERLAEALARIVPDWFDTRGEMVRELAKLVDGAQNVDNATQAVLRCATEFTEHATADLREAVTEVGDAFHEQLATVGGPSHPPSRLGLFESDARVERLLGQLAIVAGRGREVLRAHLATLHADALFASIAAVVDDELERMVHRPQAIVTSDLAPLIRQVMDRLPAGDDGFVVEDGGDRLAALAQLLAGALDERATAHLRGLQMKYYRATQDSRLLARLAACIEGVPAKLVVVDRRAGAARATELPLVTLEPAKRLEQELIDGFAPDLAAVIRPMGNLVAALDARLNQALWMASRGISLARAESETGEAGVTSAREPVLRARKLLEALLDELAAIGDAATTAASLVVQQTRDRVAVVLGKAAPGSVAAPLRRRHRWWAAAYDRLAKRGARVRHRAEALVRALLGRTAVREWIIRTGHARLDAVAMRKYVARHHAPPSSLALPEVYAELVSPGPIDDDRLATARRTELDALVAVLQPGKNEDFTSVLVTGERGSGRTSLINLLAHRLARRRVVRLDARYHVRHGGPLGAIALELGVAPEAAAVANALRRAPSIVLLDDLERFLRTSAAGIDDLDDFLRVVRATATYTHWVVTAQTATIELFDPFVHLSDTFGRRIELAPLSAEELGHVIDTRIQLSGLEIRCTDGSRRTRLRPKEAHRRYMRSLGRLTDGNLRRAMLVHAHSISAGAGGALVARDLRVPSLPFLRHLGAGPLAALALITRYVELTVEDLAEGLGVAAADVDRFLLPLRSAGLVDAASGGPSLAIPPHVVDAACTALTELGLRTAGVA